LLGLFCLQGFSEVFLDQLEGRARTAFGETRSENGETRLGLCHPLQIEKASNQPERKKIHRYIKITTKEIFKLHLPLLVIIKSEMSFKMAVKIKPKMTFAMPVKITPDNTIKL
jgi:hypothetical protein